MEKSTVRSQARVRPENHSTSKSSLNGGEVIQDLVHEAQDFAHDFTAKTLPKIEKFTRENWKQIAVITAGAAVLAAGIYMYFSKDDHEDMSEKQESFRKDH